MNIQEIINNGTTTDVWNYLLKVEKAQKIKNIIGPERIVTFHLSGHQLSDKGLIGFSGMVRYESMTEAQLDKFISKLNLWKRLPLLRFFM